MEFRWIALLALWTLISGPIFGVRSAPNKAKAAKAVAVRPAR
jgi:hypothetical protein